MSSRRAPGCHSRSVTTRAPRGLTFSVTVLSLSWGSGSLKRESSTDIVLAVRLSDRPVGTGIRYRLLSWAISTHMVFRSLDGIHTVSLRLLRAYIARGGVCLFGSGESLSFTSWDALASAGRRLCQFVACS